MSRAFGKLIVEIPRFHVSLPNIDILPRLHYNYSVYAI